MVAWFLVSFPGDPLSLKAVVGVVFTLETLQTVLVTRDAYRYFAVGFGEVEQLDRALLEWLAVPILTGVGACPVHLLHSALLTIFTVL